MTLLQTGRGERGDYYDDDDDDVLPKVDYLYFKGCEQSASSAHAVWTANCHSLLAPLPQMRNA